MLHQENVQKGHQSVKSSILSAKSVSILIYTIQIPTGVIVYLPISKLFV